jgi:phage shock protein A
VPDDPTPEPTVEPGYDDAGVPTFDYVREKIETRYGTSQGSAELDEQTPEGRAAEEQYEARQRAAAERLAQIRESIKRGDDA